MARPIQKLVQWQGFAPDADPTTPGVMTAAQLVMATSRGLVAFPRPQTTTDQLTRPSAFIDHIKPVSLSSAGVQYYLASVGNRLYSLSLDVTSWQEVTRLAAYPATSLSWSFEGFGNVALACAGVPNLTSSSVRLQASANYATRFADVAGAPFASVMTTAAGFVLLFNVTDGGSYSAPDGWWCSGRYDHTAWALTPGGSTRGRLVDSAGPVTAAIEFNGSVFAFKADSIYRGDYSPGSSEVWVWQKLPYKVGCRWRYGVCKDDSRIYFLGPDDLYAFDGVNIVPLMVGKIKNWFWSERFSTMPDQRTVQLVYDRARESLMLIAQNSRIVTYHVGTARFGSGDVGYSAIAEAPPVGFELPTVLGVRWDDRRAVRLSAFLPNELGSYSRWESGDIGDDRETIETTEVRPRMLRSGMIVTGRAKVRDRLEDPLVFLDPATQTPDGKIELSVNARWMRIELAPSDSDYECVGYVADHTAQGSR